MMKPFVSYPPLQLATSEADQLKHARRADEPITIVDGEADLEKFLQQTSAFAVASNQLLHRPGRWLAISRLALSLAQPYLGYEFRGWPVVWLNPQLVIPPEAPTKLADEGCLSYPGLRVPVRRALVCEVTLQTVRGKPMTLSLEGMAARVAQHEIAHLDGRTMFEDAFNSLTPKEFAAWWTPTMDHKVWNPMLHRALSVELRNRMQERAYNAR